MLCKGAFNLRVQSNQKQAPACYGHTFIIISQLKDQVNRNKTISPCIMCVQYIGGCSVHRGVFNTLGGYHEYIRGI